MKKKLLFSIFVICVFKNAHTMDCKSDLQSPAEKLKLGTAFGAAGGQRIRLQELNTKEYSCMACSFNELPAEIQNYIFQMSVREDRDIVFLIHDVLKLRNVSNQWASLVKSKSFLKNIFAYFWKSLLNVNAKETEINIQHKQSKALINMVFDRLKLANYKSEGTTTSALWIEFIIPVLAPILYKIGLSRKKNILYLEAIGQKISWQRLSIERILNNRIKNFSDDELKQILEKLAKEVDGFWHPALLIALISQEENYINSLQMLIKNGINLNVFIEIYLETPLMIASKKSNVSNVKALINAGADLNIKDKFGYTALFMIVQKVNMAACESQPGARSWRLGTPADSKINWRVEASADSEIKLKKIEKYCVIANILIDAGADVNLRYGEEELTLLFFVMDINVYLNYQSPDLICLVFKLLQKTSSCEKDRILEFVTCSGKYPAHRIQNMADSLKEWQKKELK